MLKKILIAVLLLIPTLAKAQVSGVTITGAPSFAIQGQTVSVTITIGSSGNFQDVNFDILFSTASTASTVAYSSYLGKNMVCSGLDDGFYYNDGGNKVNTIVKTVTVPSNSYTGNLIVIAAENAPFLSCSNEYDSQAFTIFGLLTNTPTPTFTPTISYTPTTTYTPTNTPTASFTPTFTFTPTSTHTNTPTITNTPTKTFTPTNTGTFTFTPTHSNTPTFTYTPTNTFTFTPTPSFTPTVTSTPTIAPYYSFVVSSTTPVVVIPGIPGRKFAVTSEVIQCQGSPVSTVSFISNGSVVSSIVNATNNIVWPYQPYLYYETKLGYGLSVSLSSASSVTYTGAIYGSYQ